MAEIALARPHQFDAIAELTVGAYLSALGLDQDEPYVATLADAAGRAASAELWVAVEGDVVVGTVTLCRPGSPYAEIAASDELEVRMLAVATASQRCGIGAALMAQAHAMAAGEGFRAVVLSVVDTNVPAAQLYRRLGYQRQPERDWTPVPGVRLEVSRRIITGSDPPG